MSETIITIAEDLAADESDPEAISAYIDKLYELYENPVSVNSSGENEISRLFFLSDFQVKVLSDYIRSSGNIISVYEIANIPGFDKETTEMLSLFITLDKSGPTISAPSRWRNTLITNIIFKPGNNDSSYLGSQVRSLTRYKFSAGGFSGGFTAEKDPGEKFLNGDPPLPDFLSGYFAYKGKGVIRRIIIGDFSARFGQGTSVNTGMRTGLSLHAPGFMSARNELRPYTSTDENSFFRGAGTEFSIKNFGLSLFISKNFTDAAVVSSQESYDDYIKSFYTSGLHNTTSGLLKKDAVSDQAYGVNLSYNFKLLRTGITLSGDKLSHPVMPEGNDPKNIFGYTGDKNRIYSVYYSSLINKFLIYGELSGNELYKITAVQGISIRPSDRLNVNLLVTYQEPGYFSFHGKSPGGSSSNNTGNLITGNFTFEAAKHLFISGGCGLRHNPWLSYRCSAPSRSIRKEIRIWYLPSGRVTIETVYNYNLSMADNNAPNGVPSQTGLITRSIKTSCRYSLYDNLTFGTRIDYKVAEPEGSTGMILLQEMNYRFRKIPLSIWLRYCLFNTDNWDSRIYAYENDLLYSFSIPAFYGRGSRNYLMASWKINEKTELRFKYVITSGTGSGDVIMNNQEFRFQIRIII